MNSINESKYMKDNSRIYINLMKKNYNRQNYCSFNKCELNALYVFLK